MTASPPVGSSWLAILAGLALSSTSGFGQETHSEPLRFDSLVAKSSGAGTRSPKVGAR